MAAADDEELRRLVGFLPERVKRRLRAGPLPEPDCRVCRALTEISYSSGPAFALLDFHDYEGTVAHGPMCYRRCLRVYRAAGWQG